MSATRRDLTALLAALAAIVAMVATVVPIAHAGRAGAQTVPAAPAGDGLRVDGIDLAGYPNASVTLTWPAPPADASGALPQVEVTEGGANRPAQVTALQADDLAVALVVDTSGSMAGPPLDAAKAAALRFVGSLPPTARVAVVGFGATPHLAVGLTADRAAISAAIGGLAAQGATALYDALPVALDQLPAGVATRRHVVMVSDGGDTASTTTIDAAAARLAASGVGLDVAELATPDSNHGALERLATTGGGTVVSAADPAGLAAVYEALGRGLARQYRISFTVAGNGSTPVRVVLTLGGRRVETQASLDLPAVPTTSAVPAPTSAVLEPTPSPAAPPAAASADQGPSAWALLLGGSLVFAALVLLLGPLFGRRRRTVTLDPSRVNVAQAASTVTRLTGDVTAAMDRALERHGRRTSLNDALERAGIALRPGEVVVVAGGAALGALALGGLLVSPLVGFVLAALALVGARLMLSMRTNRRRAKFAAQLGDNLQLVAGTLRSGYGISQALDVVAQEAEAPSRDEFRRVVVEARLGRDLGEALRAAAERIGSEDFDWVVQAIEINREVGGDLAVVLDNVAATIRERDRVRRQVKALSAEGRLSAYVLVGLPIGLAGLLAVINPDYLSELAHGPGLVLSLIGVAMLGAGSFWLSRLVKVEY